MNLRRPLTFLLFLLLAAGCATAPVVTPRESPAGRWTEWPQTTLREAALVPEPMPNGGGMSGTASSIINAWTSGAVEPGANRLLLVRHGGHADTAHNGVLALALTTPPRWSLVKDSSLAYAPINSQNPGPYGTAYSDGSPASLHTYDCEAWMPSVNAVYSGGGIYWSPGGSSSPQQVYWYLPATNEYVKKIVRPGGYGCAAIWDPATSRLLLRTSGNLSSYDPATDTYTNLLTKGNAEMATGSVLYLDAANRKAYRFEKGGSLWVIDLAASPVTEVALASEGDTDILQVAGAGGAFIDGQIVTYGRNAEKTRGAIYTAAVGACGLTGQPKCRWVRQDPPDGVSPPLPTTQGMWKKAFVAGGRFWVVTQSSDNVWSLLLSGGQPPVTTYPLTVSATGSGSGTVAGGGNYPAGQAVTLTATPAAGSTAQGWTPAPCAPSFSMPAAALECIQTFTAAAPPPTYPLTVSTAGSGTGTVSGGGNYQAGATVTLTATPTGGSTSAGWSPAPCAASFTMPANALGCVHTFTAAAPPVTLKPEVTITGSDTAGWTVTIKQPDGKGNTATTAVQTAIAGQAPPQPPQRYTLTITKAGTGSGTVTGAGQYDSGASVTMTATPDASSTFAGWSGDIGCSTGTVTMTANRACIATFTLKQTGGVTPRTWIGFDALMVDPRDGTTKTAWFLGSKHTRVIFDSARRRMVLAGGDYTVPENDYGSGSGQYVWWIDLASTEKVWRNLHGWCAQPGNPMPARPDNVTWVFDSTRGRAVVMPAYFFGTASCPGVSDTKDAYTFDFATNQWALAPWPKPAVSGGYGGDSQDHWGVYDPTTDRVYRIYNHGGSMKMQIIPLDGSADELISLSPYGCPSGVTCDLSNDMSTIDVQGRAVYVICRPCRKVLKYSIPDKRVVEQIPLPAAWTAPTSEYGGLDYETLLMFDSRHRVLMNPNTMSYTGTISGAGVSFYNVDTKVWESEPAPPDVSGNVLGYDAANDLFLFYGRSTTKKFWVYRYAPPADRGGDAGHILNGRLQRGPRP